jgi:hypothetical protein
MTTREQAVTKRQIGGRYIRNKLIVGGDDVDLDTADILTCPVPVFERHMAQRYADWNEFANWMEEHRMTT